MPFPMPRSATLIILISLEAFSAAWGQTWKTLPGCRMVEGEYADGDSFNVKQGGKDYVFRLYFCDTPETDKRFPDRVRTQAKYFGITQKNIIAAGKEAQAFTQSILSVPFTVITKWARAIRKDFMPSSSSAKKISPSCLYQPGGRDPTGCWRITQPSGRAKLSGVNSTRLKLRQKNRKKVHGDLRHPNLPQQKRRR